MCIHGHNPRNLILKIGVLSDFLGSLVDVTKSLLCFSYQFKGDDHRIHNTNSNLNFFGLRIVMAYTT